jgi:hypothetical protein
MSTEFGVQARRRNAVIDAATPDARGREALVAIIA